ncbi:hypothetical protein G9Q84_14945 [Pseudomonas sp. P7]|jgi:hypothetical protein|uniref:hypothetical protein n=1 Tax=Pseudomonas TaxID=286 RepID=UPI000BDD917F|nr:MULTISPECIES: hypothetical protein [Pseudomonas]MBA2924183.1 hypothetical protein [Pseudomonas sivasensis]OYT82434.1 MAG: hypothetical protein CFE48_03835 [Pseudomonas sp. PGPPP2]
MDGEDELSRALVEALKKTEVGKRLTVNFKGQPHPVDVKYRFAGGWIVEQTLIPGMSLELTRGEDGVLEGIDITIQPNDGLKEIKVD